MNTKEKQISIAKMIVVRGNCIEVDCEYGTYDFGVECPFLSDCPCDNAGESRDRTSVVALAALDYIKEHLKNQQEGFTGEG